MRPLTVSTLHTVTGQESAHDLKDKPLYLLAVGSPTLSHFHHTDLTPLVVRSRTLHLYGDAVRDEVRSVDFGHAGHLEVSANEGMVGLYPSNSVRRIIISVVVVCCSGQCYLGGMSTIGLIKFMLTNCFLVSPLGRRRLQEDTPE